MDAKVDAATAFGGMWTTPVLALRSAVVGAGFAGLVHARAIRASGGRLHVVVASHPDAVASAGHRLGAEHASADFEDALAPEVDVVHICTPNHLHRPLVRRALEAGKHVICEKPLATTVEEAHELNRLASRSGVVAAVPFVYRYYPMVLEARRRIAEGEVGELRMLHGSYLQDWLSRVDDLNWRTDARLGGASRTFADIGVHWCDLMEFVTGHRIVRVAAQLMMHVQRPAPATEDSGTIMFQTDRGALGALVVSQITPGRKNRLWFSFDGSEKSVAFDQEQPETLWVGSRERVELATRGASPVGDEGLETLLPAGHPQGYQDCFNAFVRDVYQGVTGERPTRLPSFADGLRAAMLTEAVLSSSSQRSWVEVRS